MRPNFPSCVARLAYFVIALSKQLYEKGFPSDKAAKGKVAAAAEAKVRRIEISQEHI